MEEKSLWKRITKAKWCYLALLPTLAALAIFLLYPAVNGVIKSLYFWKDANYFAPRFVGLENYKALFADGEFWSSFKVLAVFILWGFFTTFAITMPLTYLVSRLGTKRLGRFVQRAFVIPMMIPSMVITLYWKFFYEFQNGILNNVLRTVGLGQLAQVWLGNDATALPALLFMNFPYIGGFAFLILLAGFQGIDQSLHEAADMEGASAFQKFWHIDIPLVIPQIKILSMLGMINAVQQFGTQMIMTNGRYGTMVPGLKMYQTAFDYGNYGYAAAMGVVLFVIILLLTVLQNKYIQKST